MAFSLSKPSALKERVYSGEKNPRKNFNSYLKSSPALTQSVNLLKVKKSVIAAGLVLGYFNNGLVISSPRKDKPCGYLGYLGGLDRVNS